MIPTPFRFLEVEEKVLGTDAAQFGEAQLGKAPEALDAIDVVFSAGELVLVMVDAVMLVAAQDEAVIGLPAVGINGGLGKHLALDDRHQGLLGAVLDDLGENLAAALEQADDGRLAARATPAFAAHPARPKVTFVDLHLPRKRPRLFQGQCQNPQAQPIVKTLRALHTQSRQPSRRQGGNIRAKQLQDIPKNRLGNMRVLYVFVFH